MTVNLENISYNFVSAIKNQLLLIVLFFSINLSAQTNLPISRTNWGTTPSGWTDNGTPRNTTFACSGSDGGSLQASGKYYKVWFSGIPSQLTYSLKGGNPSSGLYKVQESIDGIQWSDVASFTTISGSTCINQTHTLLSTSRYVQFILVTKTIANVDIDDVSITPPSCTPPTTQTSNLSTNSPTTDGFSSSWTSGNGNGTMIAVRPVAQSIQAPSSGTTYSANVAWGSAGQIDANNRVVFRGAGTSAGPITGLSPETPYAVTAYEYSNTGDCYNLTSPPSSSIFTLSLEPSGHSSFTNCVSPSSTEITLSFNSITSIPLSNADGYIILQKQGNTAPSSLPSDGTSYSIGNTIGDATVAAIINSTSAGAVTISGLSSSTAYSFTLVPYNWNGANAQTYNYFTTGSVPSTSCATSAPQPEINLQGNTIDIVNGLIIPSVINATDFGNVSWGSSVTKTYTIQNIGSAGLNLTGTPIVQLSGSSAFSITTQPSATSIAAGNSLTFVVTFSPFSIGALTATISIANNDGNENPYTFNIQGTGVANSTSDIIIKSGFTYPTNIPYQNYQASNIINDANSIEVAQFTIRDGGASADADNLGTILSQLVLNVSNPSFIRRIALYDGTTEIGTEQAGGSTVTFSGLNLIASDGATKDFSVRVSFNTAVTDNQQIQITVGATTSASSSGSTFAATNAGGASSSVSGDNNRIEVTADRIRFTTQPTTQSINTNLSAFTIKALDGNNNTDLDLNSSFTLTSLGTGLTSSSPYTFINGVSSISNVQFSTAQTSITLTATTTGLSFDNDDVSSVFDITSIVYPNGSYRSTSDGTWTSTSGVGSATWEKISGGVWSAYVGSPISTATVFIAHNIQIPTAGGSYGGASIYILNGASLTWGSSSPWTAANMYVYSGGTLQINTLFTMNSAGVFEVEDGGTVNFNYGSYSGSSLSTSLWNGTEKFRPNSNFVIQNQGSSTGDYFIPANNDISTNTYNSFNACFGNLIFNSSGTVTYPFFGSAFTNNLTHKDFIFRSTTTSSNAIRLINSNGNNLTTTIGGSFIMEAGFDRNINISNFQATATINIKGDLINNSARTLNISSQTASTSVTLNIDGNIAIPNSGTINFNSNGTAGTVVSEINIKGDIAIGSTGLLTNTSPTNSTLNFSGIGDGLSDVTTQTINITSTGVTRNSYIDFNINNAAYVQLGRDFELGRNSTVTVNGIANLGGVLDFNFSGNTPNNITSYTTGTRFISQQGSTLKISSPSGILATSGTIGNVQVTNAPTYNQLATFHYIGKTNQVTGSGITNSSNGKVIICELSGNNLQLTLSDSTGITSNTGASLTGGKLDIRKGQIIESTSAYIYGSTGSLLMSDGTLYQIPKLSSGQTDYIPRLSGSSLSYSLNGNSTIELNGSGDQILRGGKDYRNLTFSNSGTKTLSSAPSSITGTITVANTAILDVENKTMGGAGTNLTMTGTSIYKTAGTGIKPDASGVYSLGSGTTIEFTNTAATLEDIRRASVNYFNIDVSGSNVGNSTLATPINMQSGSTFRVKSGATFHLKNTAGFLGGSLTSISSTNNPTISIETNSTIDYNGVNQTVTNTIPYQHLSITGSGTKTSSSLNDLKVLGNLQLDAELAITSTDLYVGGNWNKSATGNFNANNRMVYFDGANNSTITAYNGQYFPNIILTKSIANNILTLLDPLSIGKSLTVTSGILELASKDITLLSNDTSTASFGKVGINGSVSYGSGRFVVERYIPTGTSSGQHPKSWQFLSVPNNDGQTINQAWQDTATSANQNRYSGYGTQITGPGGIANGFDLATSAPSMKTYNSLTNTWDGIVNTLSTPVYNAKGYMLFVRGDRSVINFNSAGCTNCTPVPTKLRTRGKLFVPISNPPSSISNIPANAFESVGNPYASAIDFSNITRTASVDASFYVWDPLMNGSYNLGGYRTYTDADGYSGYKIQSGQAFFVHTTGGNGNLSFNEDVKVSGSTLTFRPPVIPLNRQFLRIKLFADTTGSKFADITTAVFDPLYSNDLDNKDAIKLTNSGENIGLLCQNKILAQEARNKISIRDTLYLTLANCRKQGYQFQFIPFQMAQNNLTPFLIDRYLMKSQEISNSDTTSINISIDNTPSSYASDRFIIVFKRKKNRNVSEISEASAIKSSENDQCCGNVIIMPNPVCDGKINIFFKNMHPGNYMCKLMNVKGQVLKQKAIQISAISKTISISSDNLPKGVYELQVTSENGDHFIEQVFIDN